MEAGLVNPAFLFLNNDIPQSEGNYRETLEVCYAVCDIILSDKHVEGAQWKGGLWRVYLTNDEARLQVLSTGVSLREAKLHLEIKISMLWS